MLKLEALLIRKKKIHYSGPYPLLELVRQHQNNCTVFAGVALHQDSLTHSYPTDTEKLELPMGMVGRQLTMKLLVYILPLELHRAQEPAVPVIQSSIAIFVRRVLLVEQLLETKQMASMSHQEPPMVPELGHRVPTKQRLCTEPQYLLEHRHRWQTEDILRQEAR
jgi:hypothetical protein